MMKIVLFALILCFAWTSKAQTIPDEDWGYITVNSEYSSNMFWWLYGSQASDRTAVPLVMWLQGGPGASSLFGDFIEVGPLDTNLKPRNTTWLSKANLIFVDNPVGTGWSYTLNQNGFSTTDEEIADNLVIFLQGFLKVYPVFQNMPFWVFSESYGGKMTATFGMALDKAIKAGQVQIDFQGVALGDSWIAPVGCMYSYADYLFSISLINEAQETNLTWYATAADNALQGGNGEQATNYWGEQQGVIMEMTGDVNFYNWMYYYDYTPDNQLTKIMEGPIRTQLGSTIPSWVTWGNQSGEVFTYMQNAFMTSGVSAVDYMLNAGYKVVVYGGQLDIIVDVICIEDWMSTLTWPDINNFNNAPHNVISINGTPQGSRRTYKNLDFWSILKAGHMVPYDNPEMALLMFETIIGAV